MSSRFPPPGRGDTRYIPHDRSPPRFSDRRPTGLHGGAPPSARGNNDYFYRANDTYAHSGPRRDPPRGPKAFGGGPTRGYGPRGRGYRGRGDAGAREYRDIRDAQGPRREQDHREWGWRDRDPSRERRPSPVGRNRSRSPVPRDLRDTRDYAPRDIESERSRRDSREGFMQPSPAASDTPLSAGSGNRGSYLGRGRLDRDFNGRSRGSFGEERDSLRPRSRSRERPWDRRSVDDRDRVQVPTRREEYSRKDWDDGDRESSRATRESYPIRSEPGASTIARSASTSPRAGQRYSTGRQSYGARNFDPDSSGRPPSNYIELSDLEGPEHFSSAPMHQGRNLPPQRASSPPQAPQVPAFGSVILQQPAAEQTAADPTQDRGQPNSTSTSQPGPSMTNVPSAPKAQLLNSLPTGPRADPLGGRWPTPETVNAPNRWPDGQRTNPLGSAHASMPDTASTPMYNEEPQGHSGKDSRAPQQPQQAGLGRGSGFVSPNKTIDDTRYTSKQTSFSTNYPTRSSTLDQTPQSSPLRIPTGPRAERNAPIAKPSVPSPGRAPLGRPSMLQRGPRGSNLRWVRPGLPQHTPRGPSIMSPMAIKKDYAEDDVAHSPDGKNEELEDTPAPPPAMRAKSLSPEFAGRSRDGNGKGESTMTEEQNRATNAKKAEESSEHPELDESKAEDNDAIVEDEHMDLDEEYLADEQKFQRQIRLLEARRPPSPRHNSKLLSLLDEIDALASAAEDRANGIAAPPLKPELAGELGFNCYPSPKLVEGDPFQESSVLRHHEIVPILTPPIDSLPYLMSGPPTPFSEVGNLQDQSDLQQVLDAQLMNELTSRLQLENDDHEEIKEQFYHDYKAWRLAVEDFEDRKAVVPSAPVTPAPVQTPLVPSMPIVEGRRSARNVSELDFERALRDSMVLADEEQQRREQEAKSSINPEKEAVIPEMLKEYEIRAQNLVDTTNLIDPSDAYKVLGYIPKPNNFTAQEQEIFTEAFLANPKKFGEISKSLPGRTYQECISHYYRTKHEQQYKEKLAQRLKKGRRGPARNIGRPKGAAPSLLSNAMVDERNQIEVTDTGRPRRAAAPTFGDTIDPEAPTPNATPARRNVSGTKGDGNEPNPERPPTKRGRGGATKDRVPRKPKTHLLAAAPGPSPQKAEKEVPRDRSKEPKLENEQQLDDIGAGELLANLQHNQGIPTFSQQPSNETWAGTEAVPVSNVSQIPKPQFPVQEHLQPQQRAGSTSSYWSVPEQTDFSNLLHHFGTNWQAIADHMKTKTQTMVKNYYHRQVDRGDSRAMEEAALAANEKIKRGEDMGQPPPPTVVAKRRYDTGPQIIPPRPLAPSIDANETLREPSSVQPSKPSKLSPPGFGSVPQKLSPLAQTESLSTKLQQPESHTQGGAEPSIRAASHSQQQRAPPGLQGPRMGFFNDDRLRPTLQPQPIPPPQQRQEPQSENRPHKPLADQPKAQSIQDMLQIQDHAKHQDHSSLSDRYQQPTQVHQPSIIHQGSRTTQPFNVPGPVRIGTAHAADTNIRPRVATNQQLLSQHPAQNDQRQELQRVDVSSSARRPDTFGAPRQTPIQSSVKQRLPPSFSPPQEASRPSSVAAPPPPPPPQAPKRSNIMSILNEEPAEPQARKRVSDNCPAAPTPPPQSPAGQAYQQSVQQFARREAPTIEPQHPLQHYHQRPSISQGMSQQQPGQAREGPSNWATVAQRTAIERQPNYQQQRAESPRLQPAYAQQGSRASLQSMPRNHAPTPPPFGPSRVSSFASLQTQQPQQQNQQSSQTTPVLHPSPYTQIHPQQGMHPHHQHQQNQSQQAPTQSLQPHHRTNAPSLFHHQYLQQRQQEAMQQQEASLQRQPEPSRSDMLQYQDNQRLEQARRHANEQARRDEAVRRIFTPDASGRHGVYGPPQDGRPRGYEDRR